MRNRVVALLLVVLAGCAVIQRASITPNGEPDGASVEAALNGSGTVLAFVSTATNLVSGDTNGVADVFVRDAAGRVSRVSVGIAGIEADGPSSHPSVSSDGRYVAFQSDATNLVSGDTNATTDVFVRDRTANTTTLVSVAAPSVPASSASVPAGASRVAAAGPSPSSIPAPSVADRDASLRQRASEAPQRVIVRTATKFRAEGRLTATARTQQRAAIRNGQDSVAALVGTNGQVTARAHTLPIVVATVDRAALDRLLASPEVVGVTADDPVPAALVNSGPVVGLPDVHDAGATGRGVAVAILDTGVDSTHPFLGGRVVDESCYSAVGSCPNGQTSQSGSGAAAPCTYAPSGCRHGTHVAGIAAGSGLDATGIAPRASIVAVQVFSRIDNPTFCTRGENPCPLTFPSDWILGLEHVYELRNTYRIAAANMSIGGVSLPGACDSDAVKPAIDQLRSVGIATVIAAGNEGFTDAIDYPACISSSVSVGATNDADAIASFSNSHPLVSLFAPGVSVRSSVPGGGFAFFNGTSMATPHVAGAFALAKEQNPNATVDEVLVKMKATGRTIHDARNGLDIPRLCTPGALGFDRCPNHNGSRHPSMRNGGKVAFESDAALVAEDTNAVTDIYLRNITAGTTLRVSVASAGTQSSAASTHASINANGDRIAFDSLGSELVINDTNGTSDVFVRDLTALNTQRASVTSTGLQIGAPSRDASLGADGTTVAFASSGAFEATDANALTDVYLHDLGNGATTLISTSTNGVAADGASRHPSVSGDGRFVVFESDATTLGTDTNGATDVYVRDRGAGVTQRVSAKLFGGEVSTWSAAGVAGQSGSIIAMSSAAGDLTSPTDTNRALDIYRRAIITPQIVGVSGGPIARGTQGSFTISGRGFIGPVLVSTDSGITLNITAVTPTQITGTIVVSPTAAPGSHTISLINGGSVLGMFGGTLCAGCLPVT